MQKITIQQSNVIKGLGVVATDDIKKGSVIEIVPLLLMPIKEFDLIRQTKLYYYFFGIYKLSLCNCVRIWEFV